MNLGEYIVGANILREVQVVLDEGCDNHYPDFDSKTFEVSKGERFVSPKDIGDIEDYQAFEILLMPVTTTTVLDDRIAVYVNPWRHEGHNVLR